MIQIVKVLSHESSTVSFSTVRDKYKMQSCIPLSSPSNEEKKLNVLIPLQDFLRPAIPLSHPLWIFPCYTIWDSTAMDHMSTVQYFAGGLSHSRRPETQFSTIFINNGCDPVCWSGVGTCSPCIKQLLLHEREFIRGQRSSECS